MRVIDLTLPVPATQDGSATARLEELPLEACGKAYTGMIYHFRHNSMVGTYIDFPSHLKETDDGTDAENYPIEKLFRVDATVIHLDRDSGTGGVGAEDLMGACPNPVQGGAMILNALGKRRHDEVQPRTVYLTKDAVQWIIRTGIHLIVSDVYEKRGALEGVFSDLFAAGISTVCCPNYLHGLDRPRVKLTALPARFPRVAQLPCRLLAELED